MCLLGHSMGVLCTHYFLHWVVAQTGSREWVDTYVDSFIAAGGPWLAAFKSTRATVFGDDMGLGLFVKPQQARPLCRAFGRYVLRCRAGPLGKLEVAGCMHAWSISVKDDFLYKHRKLLCSCAHARMSHTH